ncbi:hypothetical protein [Vibrio cincinnatiensis]|nr:hypothetical protein [Vibrio cincinnatiensis]
MKLLKEKVKNNRFQGVLSILNVVPDSFDTNFDPHQQFWTPS